MANIPIVDFSAFVDGFVDGDRAKVAKEIDEAFRNAGFVYLKNHGVPQSQVKECFSWSKTFFALPLSTKQLAPHPPGGSHHRGYSSPGLEKVSQHQYDAAELSKARSIPDYKESFESGNINDANQPNIWLPEPALPGFRTFMENFFTHCSALVHLILDALSLALRLPHPDTLSSTHAQSLFQLRLLHYPSLPVAELQHDRRSRISAHSDFGTLTLLFQDGVGGLQVEDPKCPGRFVGVQPVRGAVLVNVGDLLERWSNGRWKSTVHRVVEPPGLGEADRREAEVDRGDEADRGLIETDRKEKARGEPDNTPTILPPRYSIPFFATADPETLITALPGCWSATNPKLYEPVTATEYVAMRMAALYEDADDGDEGQG